MSNIKLFESKQIRTEWNEANQRWYFAIIDVVETLTESNNPRRYWSDLKRKLNSEGFSQFYENIVQLKMISSDGKKYLTDCADAKGLLRIIQSIPSPKAEPFKQWLAQVGSDRLDEIENPEIATQRTRELYKLKGYPDDWIEKRMRSIAIREELTEEWKTRGVKEHAEYAILTAEISKATFGLTPSEYKKLKALKNQNLRDHMTDLELIFSMLGEASTTKVTRAKNAKGLIENRVAARIGGKIAGNALKELEKELPKMKPIMTIDIITFPNLKFTKSNRHIAISPYRHIAKFLSLLLVSSSPLLLFSQSFLMQGWYWDYPKTTAGANWADTIGLKAQGLGEAGFTDLWFPPLPRASFGNNSNGYDPKDLYDYGEFAGVAGYGSRSDLDQAVEAMENAGISLVADMIYNHRDGGRAENNPGLESYIDNYNWSKANNGDNPFPYDRMRCILPLGGSSGNGAGHYYFKTSSASQHTWFHNYEYNVYMQTSLVGWQNLPDLIEAEPNGGGDCGQNYNDIFLGRNMNAWIDAGGCTVDEFHLELQASDFNSAGDTLFVYFDRRNSDYSDMRFYGIWSGPRSMNIINDLAYQTYTDFGNLPSGQGNMNWANFKPNLDHSTGLSGDWDHPYFFSDYDQYQQDTRQKLTDWTEWNWEDAGMRGLRMDAVKHFPPEFVGDLLDSLHAQGMDPGLVVGEWYGTNTAELAGWVNNVLSSMEPATKLAIYPRIFDFSLRENLRQSCDNPGFDVRNVFQGSIVDASGLSGFHVVTFLNNHDFRDNSGFASLIHNDPLLGYVYLLTNNKTGLPGVFYPDYFGYPDDPAAYPYFPTGLAPLKHEIDKLMQIHTKYIFGAPAVEYLNRFSTPFASNYISGSADKSLIFQVSGGAAGKEVIVAINFSSSTLKVDQAIKMVNGLAIGSELYDIVGNSAWDWAVVNGSNQVYIELPPRSWSVWVQGNPVPPLAPSGLKVVSASSEKIVLSWTDNSANESGFVVERKAGEQGSWEVLAEVQINLTEDSEEYTEDTEIHYRVKAVNQAGESGYSNVVGTFNHITWLGHSGDWANPCNWSHAAVPDQDCDVLIPQVPAGGEFPVMNSGRYGQIRKLTID